MKIPLGIHMIYIYARPSKKSRQFTISKHKQVVLRSRSTLRASACPWSRAYCENTEFIFFLFFFYYYFLSFYIYILYICVCRYFEYSLCTHISSICQMYTTALTTTISNTSSLAFFFSPEANGLAEFHKAAKREMQ